MFDIEELVQSLGGPEWSTDGFGLDSCLIAPDGCTIEQDGRCEHGYVSPLRSAGLI